YSAGGTLKLILPFFKAFDVTDKQMQEFSEQNIILIADTKDTLRQILDLTEAYIISTSYEHYIQALCKAISFPFQNTYCTRLQLDKYTLKEQEKTKLKEIAKEIASMPMINIPTNAKSLSDFSEKDQETINRLNQIFWTEIPSMSCGMIFSEINTIGGPQKAEAIKDIISKLNVPLSNVIYVGDSITDVEAFQLVKQNDGLAISFNGNSYAVKNAKIAVISENSIVTAIMADVFINHGKEAVYQIIQDWNRKALKRSIINPFLIGQLFALYTRGLPKVQILNAENMDLVAKESNEFRRKVRGHIIGRLG
ncbi:MAG: HAD hydrolase family protein, partial [Crenarchaeota archaeon]|nr:HAD hydrolase family protein [Thermoproteota archaeon]